ncbi:MAG TPA: cytochrome P450 [Pirellulales bacterium]
MSRRYPPGPQDWCLGFRLAQRFRNDSLNFISDVARRYGDIAYFRMGPIQAYFINQPALIRETLVTKNKSFRRPEWVIGPLRRLDGNGLVLSDGEFWRRQRRLVQPAFSTKRFDGYAQATVDYTRRMLARWSSGQAFDITTEMTRLTLEIISKTLFGLEVTGRASGLGDAVRVISETFVQEAGNPLHLPDWIPLAGKRRKREALRTLDGLAWSIVRERRASGEDRGDLLSMLLLAVDEEGDGGGMSDLQVRDEAITLFNAGHDTSAAALAWIWYAVATHPEIQNKLAEESAAMLGDRAATYADVAHLSYTEHVIKESLRLYPPTWAMVPREAVEQVDLGGYQLPRGAWVYIFPYVTHHDARFFENPLVFDPDRFAPGRVEAIPQYAYIPFGGGPRVCVGASFATMEMVLIVASVLQRFRVRLASDQGAVEPEPLIAMRPKGGLRVSLEPRAQHAAVS